MRDIAMAAAIAAVLGGGQAQAQASQETMDLLLLTAQTQGHTRGEALACGLGEGEVKATLLDHARAEGATPEQVGAVEQALDAASEAARRQRAALTEVPCSTGHLSEMLALSASSNRQSAELARSFRSFNRDLERMQQDLDRERFGNLPGAEPTTRVLKQKPQ